MLTNTMLNISGPDFKFKAIRQTDVEWPYLLFFALVVLPVKRGQAESID
jgi:hypothetical protein